MRKVFLNIMSTLFIVCLPLLYISASLAWAFNSSWLFNYGFEKYDIQSATGLSQTSLENIPASWIHYINSSDEYWKITVKENGTSFELFTREEQIHFRDVKQLVWLDYKVLLGSLIVVLLYSLFVTFKIFDTGSKRLATHLILGSILTFVILLVLGMASYFSFDSLFLNFHKLIFTNPYWSAQGYMLLLFPGGFWFDAAIFCIAFTAGLALVAGFASVIFLLILGKQLKNLRRT